MAAALHPSSPVAHGPLVLGGVRTRTGAAGIETCCPPHPAPVLSCGRGVAALLLAIRAGQQVLSQEGGRRVENRGHLPWLQAGLRRASRHAARRGQRLAALLAAHRHRVCGAIALKAREVSAIATPWRPQETTTIPLYGAYAEAGRPGEGVGPPRSAYGPSKEGRDTLQQGLLRLGVSREGLPLRMGLHDGHTSDRPEPPVAIEACWARGLDGGRGLVADRPASGQRTPGLWLVQRGG
jgi:hypothetical protein